MVKKIKQIFGAFLGKLLSIGMPSQVANVEYNKAFWNRYARNWDLTKYVLPVEDPSISPEARETSLVTIGDEWGKASDVDQIVEEYIEPFINKDSIVGEIGSGGGRIASRVAPKTKELYCFDISQAMLQKARARLAEHVNVIYVLLESPSFSEDLQGHFDFVYAFDVFVHLDLHTMWKYFQEFHKLLKDGGKAFIHTTNLKTPEGWKRFSSQDSYSVLGHYFISPEIISILAEHSHFTIIKNSQEPNNVDLTNFYFQRDYLAILEKRN